MRYFHFILFSLLVLIFSSVDIAIADEFDDMEVSDAIQSESFEPDTIPDNPYESFTNLYVQNLIVQPSESEEEEEEEDENEILIFESPVLRETNIVPIIPRTDTIIYHGTFANQSCFAVFPRSVLDSLCIYDGVLINIGTSSITGRLLFSDTLDLTDYEDTFIVLVSQFSTNLPNQLYQYSYPCYSRAYSLGVQNRIVYTDTYGFFSVVDELPTFDSSRENSIYHLVFILVLFSGTTFIFTRLSRR